MKPREGHLWVFGCDAYAHQGKFDSNERKCVLLGYGKETKGYRHFDVGRKKIIFSSDVKFTEKSIPRNNRD